jgi:hypothetical protein
MWTGPVDLVAATRHRKELHVAGIQQDPIHISCNPTRIYTTMAQVSQSPVGLVKLQEIKLTLWA